MFPFKSKKPAGAPLPGLRMRQAMSGARSPFEPPAGQPEDQFQSLQASLLYCPKCRQATPTRERLLLVLPTGNLYEYLCAYCGTSTGSKTDQDKSGGQVLVP